MFSSFLILPTGLKSCTTHSYSLLLPPLRVDFNKKHGLANTLLVDTLLIEGSQKNGQVFTSNEYVYGSVLLFNREHVIQRSKLKYE